MRVNYHESEVIPINMENREASVYSEIFRWEPPDRTLVFPTNLEEKTCGLLIDNINKCIESWRRIFFLILTFFNQYWRNESDQFFYLNLTLLSRVSLVGMTYKGVTPWTLERLGSTVSPTLTR
jgi:hypothetical protein